MSPEALYEAALLAYAIVAVVTCAVLLFVTAPYGRHVRTGWGPTMNGTLAWVLMEAPAPIGMTLCWWAGRGGSIFLAMWLFHYLYRAFVFPFRRRSSSPMPIAIAVMGAAFNIVNVGLIGVWLFDLGGPVPDSWFWTPSFLGGTALFFAGFAAHTSADRTLAALRAPGETAYRVPQGGLHRYVSCPNYLGELVQWCGFALATGAPPAWAFALWTAANLVPRALAHHRWYRRTFADYPSERRAIVPFLL